MPLIPVYTSDGSALQDAAGNQIYVYFDGFTTIRTLRVPQESRLLRVGSESRRVTVRNL